MACWFSTCGLKLFLFKKSIDKKTRDAHMENTINQKLVETGEREKYNTYF